ncbi:hypothetical protein [Bifidobacterium pseudocatenulatum]|uniref:hypothetical protein n=1 Tax=Bifidobacterium pseudocatenulatum TaxID=28026 RepID=UPI001CFDB49A|nr:hypothetical protein [Bifidobacterium pseudocatenulatum]MCB4898574.1 hypothetical protein [Bifidobacterium pseudocatenulatum]
MFTPTLMRPAGLIHERRSEGAEQTRPILNPDSFWLPSTPEQAGKETYGVSTFGPAHGHLPVSFQPSSGKHVISFRLANMSLRWSIAQLYTNPQSPYYAFPKKARQTWEEAKAK